MEPFQRRAERQSGGGRHNPVDGCGQANSAQDSSHHGLYIGREVRDSNDAAIARQPGQFRPWRPFRDLQCGRFARLHRFIGAKQLRWFLRIFHDGSGDGRRLEWGFRWWRRHGGVGITRRVGDAIGNQPRQQQLALIQQVQRRQPRRRERHDGFGRCG